ncbi:MAG TPA: hypothetical protein VLC98_15885 [Phnomibacter sp.]|nr:hypothetical protein [Phnomibacter sp.]
MKRIFFVCIALVCVQAGIAQPIQREAVVKRHTIVNTKVDSLASLTIGNGSFAFTTDVTGLQTFPDVYEKGVSLGTQSEWGWHSYPNTKGYKLEDALKTFHLNGRDVTYTVQWGSDTSIHNKAANYFRENQHRLHLGNIGFEIIKANGQLAGIGDVQNIHQSLNMWTGEIHSQFTVENIPVEVWTVAHQQQDMISVKVVSKLLEMQRLKLRVRFALPTAQWGDVGNTWNGEEKHTSKIVSQSAGTAWLQHSLDTTQYYVGLRYSNQAQVLKKSAHYFLVQPKADKQFEMTAIFSQTLQKPAPLAFDAVKANSVQGWKSFWSRGAAVDFAGSTDKRANELERRIITSLYLTKVQCAGTQPPQETGLTYNSWYGKPHLEMHWWHGVHFALWGRIDLLEKSMDWYKQVSGNAYAIAKRQGYDGLRWQKMTDPQGVESPSSIGAMLIWQQPHFIYFAELCRRHYKDIATVQKYQDLVFATADFMASYAYYDSAKGRYILGKGLIPAQERFKAEQTFNPTYELAYWYWALQTAQQWREQLQMPRNKKWDDVMQKLSPLPIQGNLYLATESATDSYTNPEYRTDHPSVFGTLGMLPKQAMVDTVLMNNTFNWIWKNWTWSHTWGWDFPMTAMTATRLGRPNDAIDALLMPIQTNTYLKNGHNYQDARLRLYLPGNGGLLAAIAMMVGGYDNSGNLPGIPTSGWKVKYEGFEKMP